MSRGPKPPKPEVSPEAASPQKPPTSRLTFRLDELAEAFGLSRRTIERQRSAGRFPPADLTIGRMPLWRPETIQRWIEGGGQK